MSVHLWYHSYPTIANFINLNYHIRTVVSF